MVKTLARHPDLASLRDVALHYNVDKLVDLVDPNEVPESTPGATDEEKVKNFAVSLAAISCLPGRTHRGAAADGAGRGNAHCGYELCAPA